jgi:hypothetical protein
MLQNDVIKDQTNPAFEKELDDLKITREQKKLIIDFLWDCAILSVEQFLNQLNHDVDENCTSNGKGKFG